MEAGSRMSMSDKFLFETSFEPEDMDAFGPVILIADDEAQMLMVTLAKDLAASGEIIIADAKGEDELVY